MRRVLLDGNMPGQITGSAACPAARGIKTGSRARTARRMGEIQRARLSLSLSSIRAVTDVVARGVVVPTFHLPQPRSVQVHRDRRVVGRVPYPVNTSVAGQDARGSVFLAPHAVPDLFQAGMIKPRAVVQTLVALLEYGSHGTAVNSPGRVVVDLCLRAGRPDKNLQRAGMVLASIAVCHVSVTYSASRFFQERANLAFEKGGVIHKTDQERSSLP